MINRVTVRNFKRFDEVTFEIPGHLVLAGPNNTGKTTLLQALSAWHYAFTRWGEAGSKKPIKGGYRRKEIGRGDFSAVSVRGLDLLWHGRRHDKAMEIVVRDSTGWVVTMSFEWDTAEQMYVRPTADTLAADLERASVKPVFVPATNGLDPKETLYNDQYVEMLIAQARPGDVLRNILQRASLTGEVWSKVSGVVKELFGYELQVPQVGAFMTAEYAEKPGGKTLDIASAGSGFQQVLLLFALLYRQPGSLLLIDEPDAHLHVILQEVVWSHLRQLAESTGSQLIVATHAETLIDAVEPKELCLCFQKPRLLANVAERDRLLGALHALTNTELMLATNVVGVLYTDHWTDRELLRAWARLLGHPLGPLLDQGILWKPRVTDLRLGGEGMGVKQHYDALCLVRDDLPGVDLIDGDAHAGIRSTPITGEGLQRLRWTRYEIESYLFHPAALERYVAHRLGVAVDSEQALPHLQAMRQWMTDELAPAIVRDPLGEHPTLRSLKARTELLPPLLEAAGLFGINYTEYAGIAALMRPDEVHPEVVAVMDSIMRAFRQ